MPRLRDFGSSSRMRGILVSAFGFALWACSRGGHVAVPRRPPLLEPDSETASYSTPARWRYHPPEEAALNAKVEFGGQVLFAGARGERWLLDKASRRARAASALAPEELIAILRREGHWLFVGKSGTSYEADQPLGPFLRSSAPFEPLFRVSAADAALVGVRRDGRLARSADGGASWQATGPEGSQFVDVALAEGRNGLALAIPEQLWHTEDGGETWKRLDTPSFGAFELRSDPRSGITVFGALEARRWSSAGFVPIDATATSTRLSLGMTPPRGPDAGALREGRAALIGRSYWELSAVPNSNHDWRLRHGPMDGELVERPISEARGCAIVRLAGFGRWLYLACSRRPPVSSAQALELWRSEDSGKSFKIEPFQVDARMSQFQMAVGDRGALMVSGICVGPETANGCKPYGVHYRRPAVTKLVRSVEGGVASDKPRRPKGAFELGLSATPSLSDTALALAFSADGRSAFALARRTKNNALAVFVSRDGARTFTGRQLADVTTDDDDDESEEERTGARLSRTVHDVEGLGVGDDGTLAIVLKRYGSLLLVVTDDEGRVLSTASPPSEANALGASGTRALAVSVQSHRIWESLDAGATWQAIGHPAFDLCPGDERCEVPVVCHAAGCVIGDELSRIGWRGSSNDAMALVSRSQRFSSGVFERKLGTALSCSLGEEGWRRMPGVIAAPTADQAAIGKAVWFAPAADMQRGAASVLHAFGGARPRVESVSLLAPAAQPQRIAFTLSRQVEGAAALRYVVPEAGTGETRLLNVEVAWDNLFEDRVVRTRLPDGGDYIPGDYERSGGRVQVANPSLFSIASGGIYLRIHKTAAEQYPTLFLDGKRVESVPFVKWPAVNAKNLRREMVRASGVDVPLLLANDGAMVVRAERAGGNWAFSAYSTGLADPAELELEAQADLAYVAGRAGLHVAALDPSGQRQSARLFVFRATGPISDAPIAVPSQRDAADRPKRCTPVERSETPRIVAPFQAGTRRAVIVTDAAEPMRVLLTDQAVLHGTPAEPCVAAYDAESISLDGASSSEREHAILPLDDLEHSWIFRASPEGADGSGFDYRVMSCRFDPNAEIPPEVYRAPGTVTGRPR